MHQYCTKIRLNSRLRAGVCVFLCVCENAFLLAALCKIDLGCFMPSDLSGQLQVVEQGLWESANISEPVVLGFNADITTEIIKINSYNMTMLLRTSQTPLRSVRRFSTKASAFNDARVRLEGLKRYLTSKNESAVTNAGALPRGPVRDFLQAEWDDLIDSVSLLLSQLQQPVQYSLTFASLLKLTDLSGLERRAELLSAYLWHHDASDPPGAYRLSAFKNARGLLVAVMREAAQVNRKYITDIILQFQVKHSNKIIVNTYFLTTKHVSKDNKL